MEILLTCEHASNDYPKEFDFIFHKHKKLLASHRGWDEGAIDIARALKRKTKAPLLVGRFSRLLIDLNRSTNHPKCYSEITKHLPSDVKASIIDRFYLPFRNSAHAIISNSPQALHLSIHSFVPILNGVKRNCEMGILYDPKRALEVKIAKLFQKQFRESEGYPRVRMNYPYQGSSDGHTTSLRRKYTQERYLGIELEFNQSWLKEKEKSEQISAILHNAIRMIKAGFSRDRIDFNRK
jgi:predicted N-formylglutamate amidohydrolase